MYSYVVLVRTKRSPAEQKKMGGSSEAEQSMKRNGNALSGKRRRLKYVKSGIKRKKRTSKSKESKQVQEGAPTNNFLVGNYGLRRAERWKDMPSMSSEVGEIQVCL